MGEVAGVDLGCAQVFDAVESGEFGCGFAWGEEEAEGFTGELYAAGEGIVASCSCGGSAWRGWP